MQTNVIQWQILAGFNGFMAIAMGAIGAHAVPDPVLASLVEKASSYQLLHAVLLLWLSERDPRCIRIARWLIALGTLLFCGTLYLKGLGILPAATALAPLGGSSFMAAWLLIMIAPFFLRGTHD